LTLSLPESPDHDFTEILTRARARALRESPHALEEAHELYREARWDRYWTNHCDQDRLSVARAIAAVDRVKGAV
jgi:hypothetical protein